MIFHTALHWLRQNINECQITNYTPYLTLTGELWGVICENSVENWQYSNGPALYYATFSKVWAMALCHHDWFFSWYQSFMENLKGSWYSNGDWFSVYDFSIQWSKCSWNKTANMIKHSWEIIYHIEAETKWLPVCRWLFIFIALNENCCILIQIPLKFDSNSTEICCQGFNQV